MFEKKREKNKEQDIEILLARVIVKLEEICAYMAAEQEERQKKTEKDRVLAEKYQKYKNTDGLYGTKSEIP